MLSKFMCHGICMNPQREPDQSYDRAQSCGHVDGSLATIDFGPMNDADLDGHFSMLSKHNGGGPNVCSEFWVDWFLAWGGKPKGLNIGTVIDNLNHMYYVNNASVNIYMIHGGTNFGFMNGASVITSYDYGAAIAENGNITNLYVAISSWIKNNITGWPQPPLAIPANPPVTNYGQVILKRLGTNLLSTLSQIQEPCTQSQDPLTFVQVDHGLGYVLYTMTLKAGGKTLVAPNIRDYGYVFINEQAAFQPGVFVGTFSASAFTDTFFNSTGWGKGQLFVNGFNVGRYWA
uniref:Glycoside hydrolase 35 catalytic domain-containing protein n=1 Tax=Acrobeloides nanus TaxID=290746 RepID=A0A914EAD2_9BILA